MFVYISSIIVALYYISMSVGTILFLKGVSGQLLQLNDQEMILTWTMVFIFLAFTIGSIATFIGCLLNRTWCIRIWLITLTSCLAFEVLLLISSYIQGDNLVTKDFIWLTIVNAICARSVIRRNQYRKRFIRPAQEIAKI